MQILIKIFALACLLIFSAAMVSAQTLGDYQSAKTGNWNDASSWQRYSGSAWIPAVAAPDSNAGAITILSGHTITVMTQFWVDSVTVASGGSLVVSSGDTLFVGYNSGGYGIRAQGPQALRVEGVLANYGSVSGGGGDTTTFAPGSTYIHALNNGSIPRSTWSPGSTCLVTGYVTGSKPGNANQNFYNFIWDCAGQTANVDVGWYQNTIGGYVECRNTGPGPSQFRLTSPSAGTPNIITINGDMLISGGAFTSNGSSSNAVITINHNGNLVVTGGNFSVGRGSGVDVTWNVAGNVSVSNGTLQNGGGSHLQILAFAKAGTQTLTLDNVAYGSGTNPSNMEIKSGSTLNIGTTVISSSNSGKFVVDGGGTLKVSYGPSGSGAILCTGLSSGGGWNNLAIATAATGSGSITFAAKTPASPNVSDAANALQRYYTITADAGITQADLQFQYDPAEVLGDEANFKPERYLGTGTNWSATGSADPLTHIAIASGVTTISGDWTVAVPGAVGIAAQSYIPKSFFVDQNYPNPFNPSTTITYGLPHNAYVTAKVYNLLGQHVSTLFSGAQSAGVHELRFDGSSLSSGVYVCRIEAGSSIAIKRMILMK